MKVYAVWMRLEPGIVGLYASKEEALKEGKKFLLRNYGDLDYLEEMQYDEYDVLAPEPKGSSLS